jgi:hypothetical protein
MNRFEELAGANHVEPAALENALGDVAGLFIVLENEDRLAWM